MKVKACLVSAGLALAFAASDPAPALADADRPIAVFPFELYDTSGEPRTPAHDRRLAMVTEQLRAGLHALPAYRVVSLDPVAGQVASLGHIYGCNGCERGPALEAGAEIAVTGLVHKVSTLIQYLQITVKDAGTGETLQKATASIRGDTDRAWRHGVNWLIEHRLGAAGDTQ